MIRGSGRAFKPTGCAALLEDLLFCGGNLTGSLRSESTTVVIRAFCFAFAPKSRPALPEERPSRVGASRAALLNDLLSCDGDETESLLISDPESLLSCGDESTE